MGWTAVEKVLHDTVTTGLGFAGNRVVWTEQSAPKLPTPFATLRRSSASTLGSTVERTETYDNTKPVGSEIQLATKDHVEFTLNIQVYAGAVQGDSSAQALLEQVQDQAMLASAQDAFRAAGIALVERGSIVNITSLYNTLFEGRASVDMTFRVARGSLEQTGYITEVDVSETVSGGTSTQVVK